MRVLAHGRDEAVTLQRPRIPVARTASAYRPGLSSTASALLGLQRRAGNRAVSALIRTRHVSSTGEHPLVSRWTNLGSWSWDAMGGHVRYYLRVGSQSEWHERLANLDDEDEYNHYMKGFLEAATDPGWARATRHPDGWSNFRNTVRRPPSDGEIMSFMRALYHRGGKLDLAEGGLLEMGGVPMYSMRRMLRALIRKYQGRVIQEEAAAGGTMPQAGVKELAGEGGSWVRTAMIQNAGATAMKGIDLVATANTLPDSTAAERRRKRIAKRNAFQAIRNAGQTIRLTLNVHDAKVAYNKAAAQLVFDTVWGTIPGGGTLSNAAKGLLKKGLDEMLKDASKNDEPKEQAEQMNNEFVRRTNKLVGDGHLTVEDGNGAINGFEAVRR